MDVVKMHGFTDVNFAKLGLAAIINLAGTPGNKALFGAADACSTVLKLIAYYSKLETPNTDIPLHGSWALLSLVDNSPENLATFKVTLTHSTRKLPRNKFIRKLTWIFNPEGAESQRRPPGVRREQS